MNESNFPIQLTEYLHGDKVGESGVREELLEYGISEENLPKYLVFELEVDVDVHENGDVYITHVAGQKLDEPIKNT